jgi:CDP-diacylglycerol--serine O-phosphatidyltransferase
MNGKIHVLRDRKVVSTHIRRKSSETLKKGVFVLPSLITTGGLFCGFFSIISTFNEQYHRAAIFIIAAHVFDVLDGRIARLMRTTSRFGIEYDSLADLVSFGVAPAVLVYIWALEPWGNWGWLAVWLYVSCGAMRLARFNVQVSNLEKKNFVGLPIPAAAEMIVAIVLLYYFLGGEGATSKQIIFLLVIYALAALMVSNLCYPSFKEIDLKTRRPFWLLVVSLLLIEIVIAKPEVMFFSGVLFYTLSGPVQWVFTRRKRQRAKREEQV